MLRTPLALVEVSRVAVPPEAGADAVAPDPPPASLVRPERGTARRVEGSLLPEPDRVPTRPPELPPREVGAPTEPPERVPACPPEPPDDPERGLVCATLKSGAASAAATTRASASLGVIFISGRHWSNVVAKFMDGIFLCFYDVAPAPAVRRPRSAELASPFLDTPIYAPIQSDGSNAGSLSATPQPVRRTLTFALALGAIVAGCGKKGPPLPPLVLRPAAPQSVRVIRQGNAVQATLTVPETNIDGASPADVSRVELFAFDGLPNVTPDDVLRRGTRVASVVVNPPPETSEPESDEAAAKRKLPGGIEQGAAATLTDSLRAAQRETDDVRSYVAVGISRRGRRGAPSAIVNVPLAPSPAPPSPPALTYDETSVTLTWAGEGRVHVYEAGEPERRLTSEPASDGTYVDKRVTFDVERCYVTRLVVPLAGVTVETDPSDRVCVTPRDTFPPVAPTGLNAVPEVGAISLIWNPVEVTDLAGYIVTRATDASSAGVAVTADPISETTFRDAVPTGTRVRYTVQAVDKSGNRSAPSAPIEETIR